jgi:CHAD domain-containing protein
MAQWEKMIQGVTSGGSVGQAARQSMNIGLATVQHYLARSARQPQRQENVHQLRVYTRRTTAALQLYQDVRPEKEVAWFAKTLRKLRRAAGDARDLDVLAKNLAADGIPQLPPKFLAEVKRRRARAQRPIVACDRKLRRRHRWRRHARRLLAEPRSELSAEADLSFGPWGKQRLGREICQFFKASPTDLTDLDSLHRFRIRGKKLRYAMELLAPALPPTLHAELYRPIEQLQELLGQINDRIVARKRYKGWLAESKTKLARQLRRQRKREKQQLKELVAKFAAWWTAEYRQQLRCRFEQLVSPNCSSGG